MKLTRVATPGDHNRPAIDLDRLSPGLNVFVGDSANDLSGLARLISHVTLGWDPDEGASASSSAWLRGDAFATTPTGDVRLRRTGDPLAPRLTVARRTGAAGADTEAWRAGVASEALSNILFHAAGVDERRDLDWLLSPRVAVTIRRLGDRREETAPAPRDDAALLARRDELAEQIESRLGEQRRASRELETRLEELRAEREKLEAELQEARRLLHAADADLGADESRRRYVELARVAEEAEGRQAADAWAPRVEDLDGQIERWRATLAELELRESAVQAELSRVRPDDAAPEIALADQRASVAVAQRLVVDLESEVARLAVTADSPACVCSDAHPRLNPLVETLGRHVDRLAALIAQQDHALRSQELVEEAEQLDRSKVELRRQIDKLLERRQTLTRTTRAKTRRPDFKAERPPADLATLEARRAAAADRLAALEEAGRRLDGEIAEANERRRRLFDSETLAAWRAELGEIEARLRRAERPEPADHASPLRASEVLARLTDGRLTELRLVDGGRSCEARVHDGRRLRHREFSAEQTRLVAAALRLALADACASAGVVAPLVLEESFDGLSDERVANLAVAIDDFARRGRQVFVFTRNAAAIDRFRTLGAAVRDVRGAAPPQEPPQTRSRLERRTKASRFVLDIDDPIERFPAPLDDRAALFGRARIATVRDLVLADPSAVADELARPDVSPELVALWQTHSALVCFLPGLGFAEAKALTAAGVFSIEDLAGADAEKLAATLATGRVAWRSSLSVAEWVEIAADERDRWRSTGLADAWRRSQEERRRRITENARRRRTRSDDRPDRPRKPKRRRESAEAAPAPKGPRFYLNLGDEVEAAPSIGAKRAAQLGGLRVVTVRDLLEADPAALADQLDDNRVDAATIVAWQHQAGLVCRVPGLRGHDAQILVGCGFTTPEEIASMKPAELLEFVEPYCDSAEGQRQLRGGKRPDLAEVADWIVWARERRAVEVA